MDKDRKKKNQSNSQHERLRLFNGDTKTKEMDIPITGIKRQVPRYTFQVKPNI